MILTDVYDIDIPEIKRIWNKYHSHSFSLPHRRNLITEVKAIDRGKLIAYGQVRPIAEPILVLDLDARQRDKIEALKLLMTVAENGIRRCNLDRMFIFARDPIFADILVKHFGLIRSDPGELLIKEL